MVPTPQDSTQSLDILDHCVGPMAHVLQQTVSFESSKMFTIIALDFGNHPSQGISLFMVVDEEINPCGTLWECVGGKPVPDPYISCSWHRLQHGTDGSGQRRALMVSREQVGQALPT